MSTSASVRITGTVCVTFFVLGMAMAGFGPAMADLARRTGSSVVAAGASLSAIYAGALVAQMASGLLLHRVGRRAIMIAGMAVLALGASGVAASSTLPMLLGSAACLGLGTGTLVLAGNVLAAEASKGAGPLNLVNAMFGVGAMVSPTLIGLSMTLLGTGIPVFWLIPAATAANLCLFVFWGPRAMEPERAPHDGPGGSRPRTEFASPVLWAICAFMCAHQSLEAGLAGWLPTLLHRSAALPLATGAVVASWFWFLMTASRLTAAWASRFVAPLPMLRGCVGAAIVGAALLVVCAATRSTVPAMLGATALGIGIGPVLPTMLALVRSTFPRQPGAATGLALSVGSIGNVFIPWALGATIVEAGGLAGSMFLLALPLVSALSLVALAVASTRRAGAAVAAASPR